MAISPQKNKYNGMAAYKRVQPVHLRCLKDGTLRLFLNDGPWPTDDEGKPISKWELRTPQSGRSQLLKKMRHKEADPLPPDDDPEATIHLFVWEGGEGPDGKPLPIPKIWDPRQQDYVSPVRMTQHHRDVMACFIEHRNARIEETKRKAEERRKEAEARANQGLEALVGAITDRVADRVAKSTVSKPKAQVGA